MTKYALIFSKDKYFNGYSGARSVQENFDLIILFVQDSADKHIPSTTSRSRSVSSILWITSEIKRKIRRRNQVQAKATKKKKKRQVVVDFGQNLKLRGKSRLTLKNSMICK